MTLQTAMRYMSIKQWVSTIGYIPEGGIRHLIFSNKDFRKRVVRKVGKKILLNIKELEAWIEEQGQGRES